jgi:hypothetical protein
MMAICTALPRSARLALAGAVLALVAAGVIWRAIDAYGDRRAAEEAAAIRQAADELRLRTLEQERDRQDEIDALSDDALRDRLRGWMRTDD